MKLKKQAPAKPVIPEVSSSSSESSESGSESDSSSDEEPVHQGDDVEMLDAPGSTRKSDKQERAVYSRSPSPSPAPIPSFLPTKTDGSADTEGEQQLKDRFRKFWMQSVADAFQDDLVQIHKVQLGFCEWKTDSFPSNHLGTRDEQISVGDACGLLGLRRGCFYIRRYCRNPWCE